MTNIVVVQFSDNVQTGRDKRFNLTCIFRGPGEAVVTSGYIGAGYVDSMDNFRKNIHGFSVIVLYFVISFKNRILLHKIIKVVW